MILTFASGVDHNGTIVVLMVNVFFYYLIAITEYFAEAILVDDRGWTTDKPIALPLAHMHGVINKNSVQLKTVPLVHALALTKGQLVVN